MFIVVNSVRELSVMFKILLILFFKDCREFVIFSWFCGMIDISNVLFGVMKNLVLILLEINKEIMRVNEVCEFRNKKLICVIIIRIRLVSRISCWEKRLFN